MSYSVGRQISLFHSQIEKRRFDDETFRILESILASKDVKSLIEVRSSLGEYLRVESLRVVREIADKSVEYKLLILDFFVRCFALAGDIECCLALRYEALLLRDHKATSDERLQVSFTEWLNFAEHSLSKGFYSVTKQACEKALLRFQMNEDVSKKEHLIEKIKKLKDLAVVSGASGSVRAQATEYLEKKAAAVKNTVHPLVSIDAQTSGSTLFRNGIKNLHARKLQHYQQSLHY